jgi:hypothetical protein
MDKLVEEEIELEGNIKEQGVVSQEGLDAYGIEESSFLYTANELFEDAQLLFEDDTCQENVAQTCSQLTKAPLKKPRHPNEQAKSMEGNMHPCKNKVPDKVDALI